MNSHHFFPTPNFFLFALLIFIIIKTKSCPILDWQKKKTFLLCNSGSPTSITSNGSNITILPNKSSLFGNNNDTNQSTKMTTTSTSITTLSSSSSTMNKIAPNYKKPHCAPKPPVTVKNGLSLLNNVNSTTNNGNSNRTIVNRTQSMRAPRFVQHLTHIISLISLIASTISKNNNNIH